MTTRTIKLRVERDITEQAVVEFAIDQQEYEEWLDGNLGDTDEDVIDYLMADREWPRNIIEQIPYSTTWKLRDREYVLMVQR